MTKETDLVLEKNRNLERKKKRDYRKFNFRKIELHIRCNIKNNNKNP